MRRQLARAVIAALVAAAVGACDAPSAEVDARVDATGDWQLEAGTMDGAPLPLLIAHPITLVVEVDRVSGTSACNRYGGRLVADGSSFRVAELGGTAAGCQPAVLASEEAYLQALSRVTTARRADDRLLLGASGVELRFLPLRAVDAAAVVGTEWRLDTLVTGDVARRVAGQPATLELGEDGSVRGSTGCRTFAGRYIVDAGEILVIELAMNGDCPAGLAEQDSHVVGVLGDGFRATVTGRELELEKAGGHGLVYRAPR